METWRSACGTYTVVLEEQFLVDIVNVARKHYPNEVGSPLFGSYSDDGHEARISGIGPLSPDSRGTRFSFSRGVRGLRKFFTHLFNSSQGRIHYVGEWHSHPNGAPTPSGTDHDNMMAIARDQKAECPECILIIIGIGAQSSEKSVYVYSRAKNSVVPCSVKSQASQQT
jgi:integrative and conjugative element protein (TIGR02256 family)